MTAITLRLPARWATIRPGSVLDVEVVVDRLTLHTLADALGRMEHNDTDPAERYMGPDALRDALIRELVGNWSAAELAQVLPVVAALTRERDEARAALGHVRDNTINPFHTMTRQGLEETVDACHEIATRIVPTPEGATP